jgi:photosystem II stability/assembly factor-like uncharacterized protein
MSAPGTRTWTPTVARASSTALRVLLSAACLCASPSAWANGRFPRADQLVAVPGQPQILVLRTTFGLLFSRDAGESWTWLCESAAGFAGEEDPALAALAGGTLLAGLSSGLAQSTDPFCAWRLAELSETPLQIVDLSVRPLDPLGAVALAWEQTPSANAFGYASRFYATSDAGATWQAYGTGIDPGVLVLTLDVAPTDAHRLYASGIRPAARTAALFVSTDDGQSWSERPVPFESPREQGVYIAGVDPLTPERLYLRTSGAESSRLLVTHDAGSSFEEVFSGRSLLGFALSPDGSEIYVGGPDNGLWVATRAGANFEQRSSIPIVCLMSSGSLLYACSNELTGFALGVSLDGGHEFSAKLHLADVRGPLACPESTSGSQCAADWPSVAARIGLSPEQIEASSRVATGGPRESAAVDHGCSVVARGSSSSSVSELWLCVGFCVASRRRRARR